MEVKAINNSVSQLGFEGRRVKSKEHRADERQYSQMDAPASKNHANYMKVLALAAMLGAAAPMTTSCSKDDWGFNTEATSFAEADSKSKSETIYIPLKPDTIRQYIEIPVPVPYAVHDTTTVEVPVPYAVHDTTEVEKIITETVIEPVNVKKVAWNLVDSLVAQGINIGIPVEGPKPQPGKYVLMLGSTAYNEYDYKLYETQLDPKATNEDKLAFVTKVTSFYDNDDPSVTADNPKVSYQRTFVYDVPGKGIAFERAVMSEAQAGYKRPMADQAGWKPINGEIRTNNRDGKTNKITITDPKGNEITNKFIRGNDPGSFLQESFVYNEYTGDYERVRYDFSNGKIVTTEVEAIKTPEPWKYGF